MTRPLFGTDGVRGRFGSEPLVESTVVRIGAALGARLATDAVTPLVLLASDTRVSSPTLAGWIANGLAASGARAVDFGILPTAALARLVPERRAAAGVVLSASHNPAEDNGIKLIGADGFKWSEQEERLLERRIAEEAGPPDDLEVPLEQDTNAPIEYFSALTRQLPEGGPLGGLSIALDVANGSGTEFAGRLFERFGARVEVLFDRPDGVNINRGCGATHPQALAARVVEGKFNLGFAFDGDADRAILVDERGVVRDGDAMLYLWARDLAARRALQPRAIVATSMSNLGLERSLAALDIAVVRSAVGDRAVVDTLKDHGLRLGGEQSGHLVDLTRSTTGDGLLTALLLAAQVSRAGRPASELLADFQRYPQVLVNVRVRSKPDLLAPGPVADVARSVETRLGAEGRLVLRYSGTEPLARVMLEGPDQALIQGLAEELAAAIRATIGADQSDESASR